ncbi:MAG: ABC transporter permease [Paenalcaligenes sp.]
MARTIVSLIAFLVILFLILPLVVIIGSSLTTSSYLSFPPEGISLQWYVKVFEDQAYIQAFILSTWLAFCATVIAIVLGIPVALITARETFFGKDFLASLFNAPLIVPYLVIGSALLQFTSQLGFSQTFWSLLVGHVVIVTPFVIRAVYALFNDSQLQLERASADLGATPWMTFRYITLPLIRPGIVSGAFFAFITSWINVELSMFHTNASLNTTPVQLFNYVQYSVDPMISAVSAITIFISLIVIVVLDLTIGLDVFASDKK